MTVAVKTAAVPSGPAPLLLCLSHLRWNFVLQRPQHLMTRFARMHPVLFWEEPLFDAGRPGWLRAGGTGVEVATPHLPAELSPLEAERACRAMLD